MIYHLDQSRDRHVVFELPRCDPEFPAFMDAFVAAFECAKGRRPDLAMQAQPLIEDFPQTRVLIAVHEHAFVGGVCVRACGETRAVA
jgi:hypothetical protein